MNTGVLMVPSRGSSETQNEVFKTSVVFLFLVYSIYSSPSCYKLSMYFLSKHMHVYLLLFSLAKIVPIYKSIRTEISPEFYQFPFVTSNITYRYGKG